MIYRTLAGTTPNSAAVNLDNAFSTSTGVPVSVESAVVCSLAGEAVDPFSNAHLHSGQSMPSER